MHLSFIFKFKFAFGLQYTDQNFRSCITKVAEDGGSCPIPGCGSQTVKINFNRGLRSNILESSVYCQSKGAGCGWVGKLDELSTHLKECPFMEEECQYHCGVHVHQTSNK